MCLLQIARCDAAKKRQRREIFVESRLYYENKAPEERNIYRNNVKIRMTEV
jgi:hypothetical protein